MRREVIVLKNGVGVEFVDGLDINTNLKGFRQQLKRKGYTEINTYIKNGERVVEFITDTLDRIHLIDAGLIRGTRKERSEYKKLTKDTFTKKQSFGYAW